MTKARLFQAVCAAALLAAAPAFAQQTTTQPADTGAGNSVNAPVGGGQSGSMAQSNMAPSSNTTGTMGGSGYSTSADSQSTGRSTMRSHASGMTHARTDNSQDATVEELNAQSLQAAQRGQAFSATDTGSGGSMSSGGSNGMMSGGTSGSMPGGGPSSPASAASGSGGGAAGSGGSGAGGSSGR